MSPSVNEPNSFVKFYERMLNIPLTHQKGGGGIIPLDHPKSHNLGSNSSFQLVSPVQAQTERIKEDIKTRNSHLYHSGGGVKRKRTSTKNTSVKRGRRDVFDY